MKFPSVAFLCCISLCSILIAVLCESSTDGKCKSLVNSPFNICISAGYNFSFSLPEKLNKPENCHTNMGKMRRPQPGGDHGVLEYVS